MSRPAPSQPSHPTTRVALITPPLDTSGGIGRLMSYVVAAVSSDEVSITLLDPRGRSARPIMSIFSLARAWLELVMLASTRRVDVAHINLSSHGSSVRKPLLLWTCRLFRIPVVLHLHASEYQEFFDGLPRLAKAFIRRSFASADVVLVLGRRWHDYVCNELGVPAERVSVLLNASPGPANAPTPQARGVRPLRILFLGRLGTRKGVPEILRALADPRLREESWSAALVGDGDVAHYRAEAESLDLADRLAFPGWVDTAETERLLATSDVLVLPSHAEGLPMSVIEAFAHAVPVVSTPVGAIADVVQEDANGLLVAPGDSQQLAHALSTLLHDEPLRLRLAQNARRTWEESLDITSYARDLALCWQRTAAATREPAAPVRLQSP